MNKKVYVIAALMAAFGGNAWAQQKPKMNLPKNWHLLSFEKDSVYGIGLDKAYAELLPGKKSKKVIVAVMDTGIDTLHEDLKSILWTNKKEIANNGKDDDKNGYIDDVHGWSFLGSKDKSQNVVDVCSEVDREYVRILKKYNNDTTRITDPADKAYLHKLLPNLSVVGARNRYKLMNSIYWNIRNADSVIRAFYKTDALTYEQVQQFKTDDELLRKGQMQLTTELNNQKGEKSVALVLKTRKSYVESAIQKIKDFENLSVNGRDVVGDKLNDINDKFYGNNLLTFASSGHGTHVAGIIAAQRNNGNDANGVADNVEIMTVRAVPPGDEYDKDIACGIRYAVDNGAKIINMSFGKMLSPQKQWVDDAMKYAESKGVLIVHAAGNDGKNSDASPSFPTKHYLTGGEATNFINVGASTPNGIAANFSNFGQTQVDLFAPGVKIMSTMPGNEYEELQGTSMACPVVAGVAALVWSYYPNLTVAQLKDVLLKSVTKIQDKEPASGKAKFSTLSVTGGIVNAYNALKLAEEVSKANTTKTAKKIKKFI